MGTLSGWRRINGDGWVALGLIAANAVFLRDLLGDEPDGAYIKTTTLPIVLSVTMVILCLILLGWSFYRPTGQQARAPKVAGHVDGLPPLARVFAVIAMTILYIAALPWFGYLLASGAYFGGLSLMYGNRKILSILAGMIGLPLVLMLFFEKYMIVLLPSARLFE